MALFVVWLYFAFPARAASPILIDLCHFGIILHPFGIDLNRGGIVWNPFGIVLNPFGVVP